MTPPPETSFDLEEGVADPTDKFCGSATLRKEVRSRPIPWYVTYSLLKSNPAFRYKEAKIIFSPVARVGTGETSRGWLAEEKASPTSRTVLSIGHATICK